MMPARQDLCTKGSFLSVSPSAETRALITQSRSSSKGSVTSLINATVINFGGQGRGPVGWCAIGSSAPPVRPESVVSQ